MSQLQGERDNWPKCRVCGLRMPPSITEDGFTTHPSCDLPSRANRYGKRTNGYSIPNPY